MKPHQHDGTARLCLSRFKRQEALQTVAASLAADASSACRLEVKDAPRQTPLAADSPSVALHRGGNARPKPSDRQVASKYNSHGIHKVPIHSHGASQAIARNCSSMSHHSCSQQCRSHQHMRRGCAATRIRKFSVHSA